MEQMEVYILNQFLSNLLICRDTLPMEVQIQVKLSYVCVSYFSGLFSQLEQIYNSLGINIFSCDLFFYFPCEHITIFYIYEFSSHAP